MVDIKTIERAYKREYKVKKINKSTKKWKKFYNAYRKGVIVLHTTREATKPAKKSKKGSFWMSFNGKRYSRGNYFYSTREEANREAKNYRKDGTNVIIDKRKAGYFFWIRNK